MFENTFFSTKKVLSFICIIFLINTVLTIQSNLAIQSKSSSFGSRLQKMTNRIVSVEKRINSLETKYLALAQTRDSLNSRLTENHDPKDPARDQEGSSKTTLFNQNSSQVISNQDSSSPQNAASEMNRFLMRFQEYNSADLESEVEDFLTHFQDYKSLLDELKADKEASSRLKNDIEEPSDQYAARLQTDLSFYGDEAMKDAHSNYGRVAGESPGQHWNVLREKYRDTNYTGCASLKIAHKYMEEEDYKKAETFLHMGIDEYSECTYRNGAEVGPLAMYNLAILYEKTGRFDVAQEVFGKILDEYPNAIDGEGGFLSMRILRHLSGKRP